MKCKIENAAATLAINTSFPRVVYDFSLAFPANGQVAARWARMHLIVRTSDLLLMMNRLNLQ